MNPSETKILLVDGEPDTVEFLSFNMKKEGYNLYSLKWERRNQLNSKSFS